MVLEKKKRNTYDSYESSIFMFLCIFCFVLIAEANPNYKIKQTIIENTETLGGIAQVIDRFYDNKSDPSGVVPCHFLRQESTKDKLSVPITQWRERHPTSYCVKFESFADMRTLVKGGKYESRPFAAGGYNWTFLIYPDGKDTVNGYVSVDAKIDNSSLITNPEDVYAEVKFFVYNKVQDKYWVHQETDARRFHLFNPQLGLPTFLATSLFTTTTSGYIFEGGVSVFGIDVFVAQPFKSWEIFSYDENIEDPIFTWNIANFTTLDLKYYRSGWFFKDGKSWDMQMYPNGDGAGEGNSLSLYLLTVADQQTYVRATLRVLDQINSNHVEKDVEGWADPKRSGWGFEQFISLTDLKNKTRGFLVNDTLKVQVQFSAFTKTDFIN